MKTYGFVIADVFTPTPFGGNQLAVLPDARGLSAKQMQVLAREFNFAESTFVFPAEQAGAAPRVRIFTPTTEVPFAGHPTVGTAAVLAQRGELAVTTLELGIGPIEVAVRTEPQQTFASFTFEREIEGPAVAPTRKAAATALSLSEADVLDGWFAGVGLPFFCVHLATRAAVDRAVLDHAQWRANFRDAWAAQLFFFSGDYAPGAQLYARMFAPAFGISEDPATGSACAALVGALAKRTRSATPVSLIIEQGVAMGRPSRIEASAKLVSANGASIKVGGLTVIVGEGRIVAPRLEG